jgi:hypothetical protein
MREGGNGGGSDEVDGSAGTAWSARRRAFGLVRGSTLANVQLEELANPP